MGKHIAHVRSYYLYRLLSRNRGGKIGMQEDSGSDSMNTNTITEEVKCFGCISSRVRTHVHKLSSKCDKVLHENKIFIITYRITKLCYHTNWIYQRCCLKPNILRAACRMAVKTSLQLLPVIYTQWSLWLSRFYWLGYNYLMQPLHVSNGFVWRGINKKSGP